MIRPLLLIGVTRQHDPVEVCCRAADRDAESIESFDAAPRDGQVTEMPIDDGCSMQRFVVGGKERTRGSLAHVVAGTENLSAFRARS